MTKGNDAAYSRAGFALSPDDYDLGTDGLTKREYFAGLAMQGLLAQFSDHDQFGLPETNYPKLADEAVMVANALIKALNADTQEDD